MRRDLRIAVIGAGLIGQKHAAIVASGANLDAIIDPDPAAENVALTYGVDRYDDLATYLRNQSPDGAIIATPNQLHVAHALACIAAGIPVLVEKPIADDVKAGEALVAAAQAADVALLVGHHRRHNPLIAAAKEAIDSGRLGRIVSVNAQFWLFKPDDYFEQQWRRQTGAGPVYINLIHDIDLLRHLCGEVVNVQAIQSSSVRQYPVEDSAVILLEFGNGALGTISVSDTVVAPWSWELTSGENAAYPKTNAHCYTIGGTRGSLSIPDLKLWTQTGKRGWWNPIGEETISYLPADPLVRQFENFLDVIEGSGLPLVSGREGVKSLRLVEAIKSAASTGTM